MKTKLALYFIGMIFAAQTSFGQAITTATLSKSSAFLCDTVNVAIAGYMGCASSYLTGNSHSTSGSTITITVGAFDPQICQPMLNYFTTSYVLTGISPGTYTVLVKYNSTGGGVSNTLTIASSPVADAGQDTIFCNSSSYQLNGNVPPSGVNASWAVITGSATLNSVTLPNATASNLSYGINEFEWTYYGVNCTTSDVVTVTNYAAPSSAVTESNKFSCFNIDTIHATTPQYGTGEWTSIDATINFGNRFNSTTSVSNLKTGLNQLTWTVSNGTCTENSSGLTLDHKLVTDTPTISSNGAWLTSTQTPAYQWYFNQQIIPGANAQTHLAQSNGIYHVLATQPGCANGLPSNEINVAFVGLQENELNKISVYPNPTNGILFLSNIPSGSDIVIYNILGDVVWSSKENQSSSQMDLSNLNPGVYTLMIENDQQRITEKIYISK
jgi:hypothetical protein